MKLKFLTFFMAMLMVIFSALAQSVPTQSLILDAHQPEEELQQRALQLQSKFQGDPKAMVEEVRRNNPSAFYWEYGGDDPVSFPGRGKSYAFVFKQKVGWGYKATSVNMETALTSGTEKVDRIYTHIYKPDIVGEVPFKAEGDNFRLDTIGMRPEVAARIAYLVERENHSLKRVLAVLKQANPDGEYKELPEVQSGKRFFYFAKTRWLTRYDARFQTKPDGDTIVWSWAYYGIPGL